MADIDLQRRESGGTGWLWGLLVLLAVAAIAWWAIDELGEDDDRLAEDYTAETEVAANEEYGGERDAFGEETYDEEAAAYNGAEEMEAAERGTVAAAFDQIVEDPQRFVGQQVTATVQVVEAASGRGFWVQPQGGTGERLFVIANPDGDGMPDITSGQTLRLDGAWVRSTDELASVADQLDETTRLALEGEDAFLTVDPGNVRVIEEQGS